MPQSFCQLNTNWGLSFRGRLAKNAKYGQAVADLKSWGDLPAEMILPNDKCVGDVLTWLRNGNVTAPDYEADLRLTITNLKETKFGKERQPCQWTKRNLESAADDLVIQIVPIQVNTMAETLSTCVQIKPVTAFRLDSFEEQIPEGYPSLLIATRGGAVGWAQRFQDHCSAPGCPDSEFVPGQLTIMGPDHTMTHSAHGGTIPYSMLPYYKECASCSRSFVSGRPIKTSLWGGLPKHLFVDGNGGGYTCDEAEVGEEGYYARS